MTGRPTIGGELRNLLIDAMSRGLFLGICIALLLALLTLLLTLCSGGAN
jgi:hypothetical protein